MNYLAVLGRQPEISLAELEALGFLVRKVTKVGNSNLAEVDYKKSDLDNIHKETDFDASCEDSNSDGDYENNYFDIKRLGGTQKLAIPLETRPLDYLMSLPEGKITIGISDFSHGNREYFDSNSNRFRGDNTHSPAGSNYSSAGSNYSPAGPNYRKNPGREIANEALKIKRILVRHGRSVRIVENKNGILSNATSLHNGLSGKNPRKVELIKFDQKWYRVIGVQDIDDYAKRDQARPARDAKVGMLPPKLAQILINLCGQLPAKSRILDPFCGTGVLLQEALLMGYQAYGTDINPRMIEYSEKNLGWLIATQKDLFLGHSAAHERGLGREPRNDGSERPGPRNKFSELPIVGRDGRDPKNKSSELQTHGRSGRGPENELFETQASGRSGPDPKYIPFELSVADATNFAWTPPISAVACESYLGVPMSQIPAEIKLKAQKQECKTIILGFLRNLAPQIPQNTPITVAIPAWLRENGTYERLKILDDIENLGYNVSNKSREGLLYYRSNQIVARDIIILRKK